MAGRACEGCLPGAPATMITYFECNAARESYAVASVHTLFIRVYSDTLQHLQSKNIIPIKALNDMPGDAFLKLVVDSGFYASVGPDEAVVVPGSFAIVTVALLDTQGVKLTCLGGPNRDKETCQYLEWLVAQDDKQNEGPSGVLMKYLKESTSVDPVG